MRTLKDIERDIEVVKACTSNPDMDTYWKGVLIKLNTERRETLGLIERHDCKTEGYIDSNGNHYTIEEEEETTWISYQN